MKNILVTGGLGFIGSHTTVELIKNKYNVIIVDDLSNSNIRVLERIEKITGIKPQFYKLNINDSALDNIFKTHEINAVIHFAAFKAVGESVSEPLKYYNNNIMGSIKLFEVMKNNNVKTIVFSSSATVYGDPKTTPIYEDFPVQTVSPYGFTKFAIEQLLTDIYNADKSWKIGVLRYFNPVGAHESGEIGEDPNGIPNNLMPYISQVAVGKRECLSVFGNDYPTVDGTGVRDYIHVVDLAMGHVKAIEYLKDKNELFLVNLGTGTGSSVLEVIMAFEKVSGKKINYKFAPRRAGDVAECFANCDLAYKLLGFKTKLDLNVMCRDTWNWQRQNPNGYN